MIEEKPEEWTRFILHIGTPQDMRKMETKLLVESNAKKNMMSFNRNNADGVPYSGGRVKGYTKKIRAKTILDAIEKECGKSFLETVIETYSKVLQLNDEASIHYYQRMFDHKELLIKVDGKVLYDGRK